MSMQEGEPIDRESYVRSKLEDPIYCVGFYAFTSARIQLEREDAREITREELAMRIGSLAHFDAGGIWKLVSRQSEWPSTIIPPEQLYDDMMTFEQAVLARTSNG